MSTPGWRLPETAADDRPTYLAHTLALAALHGPGPWPDCGAPLPDAKPSAERPLISDVVFEGIRTHHGAAGDDEADLIEDLVARIHALVSRPPDEAALESLHRAAAAVSPLSAADIVIRECRRRDLDPGRVHAVGRWLAENGTCRAAVAIGIVLLGATGGADDRPLLLLLGALDGLTLYAAVALSRTQPDRERAVFDLARRVEGWGRIHAVERLAGTDDPEIKAWLLRDGFRNHIMYEYLACTAATTGDLADALAADTVDDALLDGAGDILRALCEGGPAEDMSDYADGPLAVERYLRQVGRRRPTLARIAVVVDLSRYLPRLPFSAEQRTDLSARCTGLIQRPDWRATLAEGVDSDDIEVFRQALGPAAKLGVRAGDRLRQHLRAHPDDPGLWFPVVDAPGQIERVVELATEVLPLDDLVTGPGLDIGIGGGPASILDLIVSRLDDHPGVGWRLVRTALSNETIRNRNMALNVLEAWPVEAIPAEAAGAVRDAVRIEPDTQVRHRMREVLRRL